MKTKHYLYTLALACMSWGATSCTDILNVDPLNSFSDEAVWSDLSLSETYLNAQYTNLWAENMKGTRFAHLPMKYSRNIHTVRKMLRKDY